MSTKPKDVDIFVAIKSEWNNILKCVNRNKEYISPERTAYYTAITPHSFRTYLLTSGKMLWAT